MANNTGTVISFIGLIVVTVLARIGMVFFSGGKLGQITTLDYFIVLGVLMFLTVAIFDEKVIVGVVKEYDKVRDVPTYFILGAGVGLVMAYLSIGENSVLGSFLSAAQGSYIPYGSTNQLPENTLSQLQMSITSPTQSAIENFFSNFVLNYYVALGEEILKVGLIALLMVAIGKVIKAESPMELYDTNSVIVLFVVAGIFSVLHIFAYTGGLEYFNASYFISAFIMGLVFGLLFFYRGILPAVSAHWFYNISIISSNHTGLWEVYRPFIIVFIVVFVLIYYFVEYHPSKKILKQLGG